MTGAALHFGPFSLEATKQLWRGDQQIHLRRQTLALLRYLAERPGQLVDKEELLKQLWPGIYVSPTVVKVCVREIRHALGDEAAKPRFIETVGMQGYRFIPPNKPSWPVLSEQSVVVRSESEGQVLPLTNGTWKLPTGSQPQATDPWHPTAHFVGREYELGQLQTWYERVQQGQRQLIFVSGEAGIGKTALVEHFLAAQAQGTVRIGRGHCIDQYEHGEAYLPVLQALQQLCRAPNSDQVVAVLRRYAPLWLVQLTGVIGADELERLQLQVQGSSPQRMLREFADAMEVLTAETPVVLLLEDLQWSDAATLELLEYLAQRRERARLLVLGCYRPGDAVLNQHPLRRVLQKLIGRGQCQELALELFTPAEVEAYLSQRMAGSSVVDVLGSVIHRRTEGNALFVMDFVDYLLQRGLLVATADGWELRVEPEALEELIPDHVQQLIAKQVEDLSREVQQLLEIAGVVGMSFTAGEVAAVLNQPLEAIEAVYDELASQGRFLEVQGLAEWPDGSITVRYRFRHALCRHTLYHRVGLAQRVRWHRQLGEHFVRMNGEQTQESVGELAFHFECGREYRRAALFWQQAGEYALGQSAYQKALGYGQAGLKLLPQCPDTAERRRLELRLRQIVSHALAMCRGFADDELEENLQQTRRLCRELADEAALVPVVIGLARRRLWRADRTALEELAREEESLTQRISDPQLLTQLHTQLAWIELIRGKHGRVVEHYQHAHTYHDPRALQESFFSFAGEPLVVALGASGVSLSLTGWLDQGWSVAAQGLARAAKLHQPSSLAFMLLYAGMVRHLRGEYDEGRRLAQKLLALGHKYELPLAVKLGQLFQGGMAVHHNTPEDSIALLTAGLGQYRTMGVQLFTPYFLSFIAEGYRRQGKGKEALQTVHEALTLTSTTLDVFWEAELYRLKGELTLQSQPSLNQVSTKSQPGRAKSKNPQSQILNPQSQEEAEECFLKAIEITRRQEAKVLELRATTSLARLWQQQGKKKEARQKLSGIYHWFTEGLETRDLQEAKTVLAELGEHCS